MPTISVDKDRFFSDIGRQFTDREFDDILFDYGLELDEDTSVTAPDEKPYKLKIEVPANRYDLLCHQGLVLSLRNYLCLSAPPAFALSTPPASEQWTAYVRPSTAEIRPYFASAILRGVQFNEERYKDFIELQDKLHGNLCRKRTLVAIGTHDLAKMDASTKEVSYEALPPKDIKFAPLNKEKDYSAEELMTLYESDKHLSKYLHIIRDSPVYPIIYDKARQVLSMPPIINSNHTKISLDTRDVFIDVTATDQTKLDIVVNIVVTMFAQYCSKPFSVEPVNIVYEHDMAQSYTSPKLEPVLFTIRQSQINSTCGFDISREESVALLQKMGHVASLGPPPRAQPAANANSEALKSAKEDDLLSVLVPPTRPDILHECDLIEDVAVAYGFNNIKRTFPSTNTVGEPYGINKLADLVRRESAMAGWLEVLPLTLCSHDENFAFLNRKDDKSTAVVLSNPATFEYQVVRTSLLPGMLKTVRENRKHPLPMRIFEVSDVVLKDDAEERRARNERRVGAVYVGKRAGFEVVHGLLDRLMAMLNVELGGPSTARKSAKAQYYIQQAEDLTFFPGRAAKIFYRPPVGDDVPAPEAAAPGADPQGPLDTVKSALASALPSRESEGKDVEVGSLGILHPSVLDKFELDYPCSALEFNLAPFL